MIKSSIKSLIIFLIIILSQNLWAKNGFSSVKGKDLMQWCAVALGVLEQKNISKDVIAITSDAEQCFTYIVAVNDALFMQAGILSGVIENKDAQIQMPYCFPDNVGLDEYIKVILKYINENPDALDVHASIVVYAAFKKNYPCN